MKTAIIIMAVIILVINSSISYADWWNPFTWFDEEKIIEKEEKGKPIFSNNIKTIEDYSFSEAEDSLIFNGSDIIINITKRVKNPSGKTMPLSSIDNFNKSFGKQGDKYKHGTVFNLPNNKFKYIEAIQSNQPLTMEGTNLVYDTGEYQIVYSVDDWVNHSIQFTLIKIDDYNYEYVITEWESMGYNQGDYIDLDPTIQITTPYNWYPSIAMSKNGSIHIVSTNGPGTYLSYCNNENGSFFCNNSIDPLEPTTALGQNSQLLFDSQDNLHIFYYGDKNKTERHAIRWANNGSFSFDWMTGNLSGSGIIDNPNFVIDKNDIVQAILPITNQSQGWQDYCNNSLGNQAWSCRMIYNDTGTPSSASIVSDYNNVIHTAFYTYSGVNVYCNSSNGTSGWGCFQYAPTHQFFSPAIAIDKNNKVHIAVQKATANDLYYCNNLISPTFNCTAIDTTGSMGGYPTITVDNNSIIRITHYDDTNDWYMYCDNSWVDGSWRCENINGAHDAQNTRGAGKRHTYWKGSWWNHNYTNDILVAWANTTGLYLTNLTNYMADHWTPIVTINQPPNYYEMNDDNVFVNATILENNITQIKLDWNGTNYTHYNSSLILMFNFDNISAIGEGANNKTVDVSMYGNNGTCYQSGYGAVCNYTTGRYGKTINFSGGFHVANTTKVNGLPIGNSSRTIEAWIYRTDSSNEMGIIQYGIPTKGKMNGLIISGNNPDSLYFYGHLNDTSTNADIPLNDWVYITMTYNGTHVSLYLNGTLDISTPLTLNTTIGDGSNLFSGLTIGMRPSEPNLYWGGLIDEVRIWNTSLSSAEILQHYKSNLNKYGSENWTFVSNQTNLTTGAYDYTVYGIDGNSNTGFATNMLSINYTNISRCMVLSRNNTLYKLTTSVTAPATCMNITGAV